MPNYSCPNCGLILNRPDAIVSQAKAKATFHLDRLGQLVRDRLAMIRRGRLRCSYCGHRMDKFVKQAKVGVIKGTGS